LPKTSRYGTVSSDRQGIARLLCHAERSNETRRKFEHHSPTDEQRPMKRSVAKSDESPSPAAVRIVKTARELFFAHGFSAVTTDRLCKEAAVSKASLYKYFGDMAGVLSAVVRSQGDVVSDSVIPEPKTAAAFWSSLVGYGVNLLTLLNQRNTIEFDRMLHEQSRKLPEVSRLFYDAGYGRSHLDLTGMIEFGKQQGFVTKPQPSDQLADNLFCMWEGLAFTKTRLGLLDRPYADPTSRAREGVKALFEGDCVLG
jgi:TetR/AcrR family transcriptional regulator, mexJK operon transcriptional repressor